MSEAAKSAHFESLLARSLSFEERLGDCLEFGEMAQPEPKPAYELAAAACVLCIEHGRVLRAAFAINAPNSGAAVLRLQFESLLRAAWTLYAATPQQVEKLGSALSLEAEQRAKRLPGYADMLQAVTAKAPEGLVAPLAEFNEYSRHALNSYVHSGIHPLHRVRSGFQEDLAGTIVRFSNGLLHLAYRILASLSGSQQRMDHVTRAYKGFEDCLPMESIDRP